MLAATAAYAAEPASLASTPFAPAAATVAATVAAPDALITAVTDFTRRSGSVCVDGLQTKGMVQRGLLRRLGQERG